MWQKGKGRASRRLCETRARRMRLYLSICKSAKEKRGEKRVPSTCQLSTRCVGHINTQTNTYASIVAKKQYVFWADLIMDASAVYNIHFFSILAGAYYTGRRRHACLFVRGAIFKRLRSSSHWSQTRKFILTRLVEYFNGLIINKVPCRTFGRRASS